MKRVVLIIGSFALLSFGFYGENWEFQKEKDGVRVYTAKKEGSNYKKCKAIGSMKVKLDDLYDYLRNPLNYKKFSNKIESIKVIKTTEKAVLYYIKVNMPWPVYNRDGVYKLETVKKTEDAFIFKGHAEPDLVPEQPGYIRVQKATNYYNVKTNGDKIDVHYEGFSDPNGSVPAWVVNYYLVDGPINNFTQMKKDLE